MTLEEFAKEVNKKNLGDLSADAKLKALRVEEILLLILEYMQAKG